MILRAAVASWFELLTSREELGAVLEGLATTKSAQLQAYSRSESRVELPDLRLVLQEYETLAKRYGHVWPPARRGPAAESNLLEAPRAALERLRQWAAEAAPFVAELEQVTRERADAALVAELLASPGGTLPALDGVARAGPVLASRLYLATEGALPQSLPAAVITQRIVARSGTFLLAVGPAEQVAELDATLSARRTRRIPLPPDLPGDEAALRRHSEATAQRLDARERAARESLGHLDAEHRVAEARGELARAAWLVSHVPELPVTEHFAWVTGWCADPDDSRLRAALDARGLHYLLRMPEAPEGTQAPTVLRNPAWARPFEVFPRLMGVPGAREADPSAILAVLAPLMFGYMFGDVVQGLVVAVAGLLLQRRLPALRLLVPGGLAAVAFGFAFGSVFAREDVVPALWVRPLEQPLVVLVSALGFGVLAIATGLAVNALQFHWRGAAARWLATEAGLALAYGGIVAAVAFEPRALWALPAGMVWYLAGEALTASAGRAAALGRATGELVERLLQLGVNTVSFVRVGAFALAHAGLCTAVVGMAEAAGPAYWPVLILGNAAIVVLEGLVVSIQTTRLILFEFFIRFMAAGGRPFEPLPEPADADRSNERSAP